MKPRHTPRVVTEDARLAESDQHWDHMTSGTQPQPFCRWAARGMRCDCLLCVKERARSRED